MILYKAIKYYILDYCIGILVSGVLNNTRRGNKILCKDIVVGMKFSLIRHKHFAFKNCIITKIYKNTIRENSVDIRFLFRQPSDEWSTSLKATDKDTEFYI